jgi:hydrolase, tatD family
LTPPPYRGKRNEPAYVRFVADEIAVLRGTDSAHIRKMTWENGKRLFGLL